MNEQFASAKLVARVELADEPDFDLGNMRVCPSLLQIRAGDSSSQTLEPRVMQVLVVLARAPRPVISRDDFIEACWDGRIVGDDALERCIGRLRKLSDWSGRAFSIETIPRVGYRLNVVTAPDVAQSVEDTAGTIGVPPSGNLPLLLYGNSAAGPGRLVGRREQLRIVSNLLAQSRLVTLTGPGGVGKTTLALRAAAEASPDFPDGVWLVDLAALNDPYLMPGAIASVLGVQIGAKATPLTALSRFLARKSVLIVLDNCEHVIGAAARISEILLAAAAGLKILATSREPLSCAGEQVMEIPPLAVPPEREMVPDLIRGAAAVDLFIERATEADANFRIGEQELAAVARICRRVDGLPLAIEMVAGWAGPLGLETLDSKLDGSLKAWLRARTTAPARHSTLRATLEWSHGLLSASEQAVLRRLAVFAGSFSIEAAEALASDDGITKEQVFAHAAKLTRKSMIAVVPGSRPQRFRLLHTTRAFMLEKLTASGEDHAARRRHARHMLQVLERATAEWDTTSDAVWLERYRPMVDDVRSATDWAIDENSDDLVALTGASWALWRHLSLRAEGIKRFNKAAARLSSTTPPVLEARLRHGLGSMLLDTAAIKAAHTELEHAASLYRGLGDRLHLGGVLAQLAYALLMLDRNDEAEHTILEALGLLEASGSLQMRAVAYSMQLCIETVRGHFEFARAAGEKAVRLCEIAGNHRTALVVSANLVQLSLEQRELDDAISAGRDLLIRLRDTPYSDLIGFALGVLAAAMTLQGHLDEALTTAREAAPLLRDEGMLFWLFDHLALRSALAGRPKDAALIAGYASAVHEEFGHAREPMGRRAVAELNVLLRETLPETEIAELTRFGAQLSEDQAMTLALSA